MRETTGFRDFDVDLTVPNHPIGEAASQFGAGSLFIDSGSGANCLYSRSFCNADPDCCAGYNCVTTTCKPDNASRTSVSEYDLHFFMPAPI